MIKVSVCTSYVGYLCTWAVSCMYQRQPNTACSRADRALLLVCRHPHHTDGREQRQSIPWDARSSRQAGLGAWWTDISLASAGGAALGGHSALLPFSVLDVNDENPTFFPAVYNVSLPENVARDFKVVRLNCTDADIGLNAELSYFITGMNPLQSAAKGSELSLWKGARQPPDLGQGVLHISTPFSSPSKACTVSPSAEQPRLAPCFADRSAAIPCPARGERSSPSIPCHLTPPGCSQEKTGGWA